MDPITALGAVSSAVGIASFALDLSVGLSKIAGQIRSAKYSLKGVGETVKSTAYALEEVEQLLRKEEQHVLQGGDLRMFSAKGLARVKETTDQCLLILWKIEAVAIGCEEPDEAALAGRLAMRASASAQQAITLHPWLTNPSPSLWKRFIFVASASDKLVEYGKQLQNFQISLGLIFDVVTVTYLLNKSSLTDDDRKAVETAKEDLHRPRPNYREVAQVVLHGINPSNEEVGPLPEQAFVPDVQRLVQQPSRTNNPSPPGPVSQNTAPFGATNMLFAVHSGLGKSPEPRMRHSLNHRSPPSTTSRGMTTRDIESEQSNEGNDAGRSLDPIIPNADAAQAADVPRQSPPSFQSFTAIRGGNSDYASTPTISGSSSSHVASLSQGAAPNPMKVYSIQNHGDWRQEKLSHAGILQRLAKLDLDPIGVLDKKLKLPMKHQTRIDAIQGKVNGEEANQDDYEWTLRQLELKEKRLAGLSLGRSWGLLAIIVYLEREALQLQSDRAASGHIIKESHPPLELTDNLMSAPGSTAMTHLTTPSGYSTSPFTDWDGSPIFSNGTEDHLEEWPSLFPDADGLPIPATRAPFAPAPVDQSPASETEEIEAPKKPSKARKSSASSSSSGRQPSRILAPQNVSFLIPAQVEKIYLDATRHVWVKAPATAGDDDEDEDDPFAGIPDLPVDNDALQEKANNEKERREKTKSQWRDFVTFEKRSSYRETEAGNRSSSPTNRRQRAFEREAPSFDKTERKSSKVDDGADENEICTKDDGLDDKPPKRTSPVAATFPIPTATQDVQPDEVDHDVEDRNEGKAAVERWSSGVLSPQTSSLSASAALSLANQGQSTQPRTDEPPHQDKPQDRDNTAVYEELIFPEGVKDLDQESEDALIESDWLVEESAPQVGEHSDDLMNVSPYPPGEGSPQARSSGPRRNTASAAYESMLDEDLIKQLMLLLTPARLGLRLDEATLLMG